MTQSELRVFARVTAGVSEMSLIGLSPTPGLDYIQSKELIYY
jgi:hypothetical protein